MVTFYFTRIVRIYDAFISRAFKAAAAVIIYLV